MHILHLTPSVGSFSGGMGTVALNLAHTQEALGYQTTIWTLDEPAEAVEIVQHWGFQNGIVTSPTLGPKQLGYTPMAEKVLGSQEGKRFSVLHQHGIWTATSRVTERWRRATGGPTVIAPHGSLEPWSLKRSAWKKQLASLLYEAHNLRLASCLHATVPSEAESFRNYGLHNPIAIIPNGVPDSWLQKEGVAARFRRTFEIPEDKRILLFLARVHPKKGLPLLFRAMAAIGQELANWRLVIAGNDEEHHRHELESLSKELEIEELIQFVGPLFGEMKKDAFAAADLFILPTHSENFAITVIEALGAGVPVITTRGAPWEALQLYRCGWWTSISQKGVQEALLDALSRSVEERTEMGRRGKELVARHYTWDRVAQKTVILYDWLLGRSSVPDFVTVD